jgi:hypothetical protein
MDVSEQMSIAEIYSLSGNSGITYSRLHAVVNVRACLPALQESRQNICRTIAEMSRTGLRFVPRDISRHWADLEAGCQQFDVLCGIKIALKWRK